MAKAPSVIDPDHPGTPEAAPRTAHGSQGSTVSSAPRRAAAPLVVGCAVALAVILWLVASEGADRYLVNGDSYPGALTAYGAAVGRLVGTLAAALTFGSVGYAALRTKPQLSGELGLRGYLATLQARRYAAVWAVVSVPMVLLSASDSAGQDLFATYRVGGLSALVSASETAKGWLVSLASAVIVGLILRAALTWGALLWAALPAAVGMLATVLTANEAQGPNHDYSTAAVVFVGGVGGLWLGALWSRSRLPSSTEQPRRRAAVAAAALLVLAGGAVVATVYAPGADLWRTRYGWLLLATAVLTVVAAMAHLTGWTAGAAAALTVAVATGVSASLLTPPTFLRTRFTIGQVFMGYDLPEPPSALRLLTLWRVDLNFVVLAAAMALGYLLLARRHGNWKWYRTACFLLGCAALVILTGSGVSTYAKAMFSVHMVTHMLMTSLVPVLLLLGAPVTLLRETLNGESARRLELLLRSRSLAVLMRPAVLLVMFAVLLYGLYFTPLFDVLGRYHWGHLAINLALLATGFLFCWRVFQIDPVPRQLPFIGRVGMLLAMMPISMVFALIVMTMDGLVGPRLYYYLDLPWMTDLHHDQFVGGVAAWAVDEASIALVTVGLVLHWAWQNRDAELDPL